ncbi:peptide ABC transporter substrate-binding protein [Conservatibacter flavescens]|uniref:Solute-binding protein family 5 domain-containing protein n=1 Tax=Conservatibacter flavescens TaxID=28161 RepID=A0A2M8S400_9PAST|nr:peptide ABC transporter substrate-binding protein [Conservatibacter flavescens]PJG85873.1 hypothetical protein CVP05_03835 [Conservatibacter flavescens]
MGVKKKSAVIFAAIWLGLTGCEPQSEMAQPIPHTPSPTLDADTSTPNETKLTRGVYDDLTTNLYQAKSQAQFQFLRDLFEGLVIVDTEGKVQAGVAEAWQSTDKKTWFFTLRQEAKWSNGEAVTAHDFVRSWQQLALSDSPLKAYLPFINLRNAQAVIAHELPVEQLGISAKNDRTLQIELDKAVPYLPDMLAHVALLPQYLDNSEGAFISNGAYRVEHQEGAQILLQQNPYYWAKSAVHFEQVFYQKLALNSLFTEIDLLFSPSQDSENTQYFPQLCTYYYEFNFRDPMLKERGVRNALVSLISPSAIVQNEGINGRADGHFLPYNLQQENEESWNPTVVEQLLQQQGVSETKPLQLRLTYDTQGMHSNIAQRIIRMWSQSDMIRVNAEPVSWQQLQEKRNKGDFQVIRSGWCADYNDPSAFLNLLYSRSPDNKMGYQNDIADKLLEQSLEANLTSEQRMNVYQQLEQLVQNDYVFLPIFQYRLPVYIDPSVGGYKLQNPTQIIYSKDLYRQK